jgi:hypothetical protein
MAKKKYNHKTIPIIEGKKERLIALISLIREKIPEGVDIDDLIEEAPKKKGKSSYEEFIETNNNPNSSTQEKWAALMKVENEKKQPVETPNLDQVDVEYKHLDINTIPPLPKPKKTFTEDERPYAYLLKEIIDCFDEFEDEEIEITSKKEERPRLPNKETITAFIK